MERSLVRPTNYNELGLFGGIRESIASECPHNSSGFASILNQYFNRYFLPRSNNVSHPIFIFLFHATSIIRIPSSKSTRILYRGKVPYGKVVHTVYPFEIKVGVKTEIDGIREGYPVEQACTLTLLAVWPRYRSSISIYHAVIPSFFVGINIGENDNHGDKYRASGSKHVATAIPRVNPTMPPLQHSTPKNPISYFHDV